MELKESITQAAAGGKYQIARLITEIEKPNSFAFRKRLFKELFAAGLKDTDSVTLGFTGTPGAGKSSLLGELCTRFLKKNAEQKVAVVAIDPSSNISGGSILGDRTRFSIPPREVRLYFRSQPSQLELGGVNPYTYHVIRLLRHFFDYVFVETVGIGQNEIEVSKIADFSFLLMQPLGGDQIQFMKSGIMETPDAFIINKCDEEELANSSYNALTSTLEFMKGTRADGNLPPIFRTSVVTGLGVDGLLDFVLARRPLKERSQETRLQIMKWLKNEYGNFGMRAIDGLRLNYSQDYESLEEIIQSRIDSLFS